MTDEELLGYLRRSSVGYTHPLRLAADRIEALVKERDRYRAAFNTNCLVLRGTEERAERLEAAMQKAIMLAEQPHYGDRGDALDHRFDAIDVLRAALKGADHE